jgi:DNA-binding response OmpR family regulator
VDAAGRRILVVDDDAPMLEVIGRLLTLNAFEVDAARTVEEAGPMALSGGYSGLVLDLILPDGNGLHLFRRIARERPALSRRIVFVSGRLDRRAVARFQRLVGNRLILKPFDLNELLRAVREATAAAR